jgi:regulatory protein
MTRRQNLTKEQALQKARHYCAYQERCHSEVKDKLYALGLWKKDVEEALSLLIEENYLNEERFAIQFAGGHFRMKGWGRVKISYELKQKQVGEYCIKKALVAIDEADYQQTLEKLATDKWEALDGEENKFARVRKLQEYLWRKGYEADLAARVIKRFH